MKSSKVRPDNYITIQGWMLTDLKLKGNALLIYAAIYGFSQAENQMFTGSVQYLADWTNSTRQGVHKVLKKLCDDGLLFKEEEIVNNVKFCKYSAVKKDNTSKQNLAPSKQSLQGGDKQNLVPSKQSLQGGDKKSLHNKIDIDNTENKIDIDNIENNTPVKPLKKKKEPKKKEEKDFDSILQELDNPELEAALREFIKMRKTIKKPLTPYALELAIKELFKLSESKNIDEMTAIVNQSIKYSWQGLFPLKNKQQQYQQITPKKSSNEFLNLLNQGGF